MLRYTTHILFCLILMFLLIHRDLQAQIPYQVVPLTAEISVSPPSISVKWPLDPMAPYYRVSRKAPGAASWQELATLPGTATEYTDLDVAVGDVWEYSVVRSERLPTMDTVCVPPGVNVTFTIHDTGGNGLCCWNSDGYWELHACGKLIASGAKYEFQDQFQFAMCGSESCEEVVVVIYPDHQFEEISWELHTDEDMVLGAGNPEMAPMFGYVLAGIDAPATEQQGTILLLVDQEHAAALQVELERLRMDLIGEGWLVAREDVAASTPVTAVKDLVLNAASQHPDLGALLLIGKIPVPYSGKIAPDDHVDHVGAWPADLYYAELDGPWTDVEVDWSPSMIAPRNHNVPGDGKFDQSALPSDVDLIIGRVDFSDLSVFPTGELELLRAYLDRDHAFRTGQLSFQRRAVIDENFPYFDHESAVYRSCVPMFGEANVMDSPFIGTLSTESALWAMAGGAGSYTSASGIGTAQDLAETPLNGAFAHILGSYFGDWNVPNNFLRSTLASGSMLGVVWGLQEMMFHHMALGRPIGESVRHSQNSKYEIYERQGRLTHLALMGDPTLQLLPMQAVQFLQAGSMDEGIFLQWSAVPEEIIGYNIYRRNDEQQHFQRVNEEPLTFTYFLDADPPSGMVEYMVRAVKLEQTASGTFHVLSTGKTAEVSFSVGVGEDAALHGLTIYPSPSAGEFSVRHADITPTTEAKLLDLSGQEVAATFLRSNGELRVHTEQSDGMYLLQLIDAQGRRVQRTIAIAH